MSHGKKQQKKRKRLSSPFISQIGIRLEKLRRRQKDLWGDDDDDDDDVEPKIPKNNNYKSYIVLSDSDEERPSSSKRRSQSVKSKEKFSQNHVKNVTCLICSILSQLSSYNCCSKHLSILKNHSHHQQETTTTTTTNSQCLPEQVMILPITNEIVGRYLDPEQVHHLRSQTSTSPTNKKSLSQKSITKSTMTSDLSEPQQSAKSPQTDIRPLASTIVVEAERSNSATVPPDITTATTVSSISVINNSETVTIIDIEPSSIQQETTLIKPNNNERIDPWIPISDEIDAALEQALDHIDSSSDTPLEFTPATARRTETEVMAACLPKIPLKQGRFRQGKPIINRTTSNAANEYRPLAAAQSSSTTSFVITANVRSPLSTTTNIEQEPTRSENSINNGNDNIFTQDETNHLPTTRTNDTGTELSRSNETQHVNSSTTKDRTTPSRVSFRMNPDGTRVSISRPPLPTTRQSPLKSSLRRNSTDVTPIQPNTKQV